MAVAKAEQRGLKSTGVFRQQGLLLKSLKDSTTVTVTYFATRVK